MKRADFIHLVRLSEHASADNSRACRRSVAVFAAVGYFRVLGCLALDRPRFLAVMAHEYGHLRSDHGQFAAWIYRTRLSWTRLEQGLRHDEGPAAVATQAFLRWYFPQILANALARRLDSCLARRSVQRHAHAADQASTRRLRPGNPAPDAGGNQ